MSPTLNPGSVISLEALPEFSNQTKENDLVTLAVQDHLDAMLASARLLLRSEDLAWDAVQEALQALWKEGSINSPLRGWLLRTVRHRALHMMRSERRRNQHESACACLKCIIAEDSSALSIEDQELIELVSEIVENLPANYRTVLKMCDWLGLEYETIAQELKIPIGTVRSRLSRARSQVRAALKPYLLEKTQNNLN